MSVAFSIVWPASGAAASSSALYVSTEAIPAGAPPRSTLFYYAFLEAGVTAPDTIADLSSCFDTASAVFRGAFVFVDGTPPEPEALFQDLQSHLVINDNPATHSRLAWRRDAADYQSVMANDADAVPTPTQLPFGRWIVKIGDASGIAQSGDAALSITPGSYGISVVVNIDGIDKEQGSSVTGMDLPLTGPHAGSLQFDWQWNHTTLQEQFGGAARMVFQRPAANGAPPLPETIHYPLFTPPPAPGPFSVPDLAFAVTAHPLAPLSGARTRLALQPQANDSTMNTLKPLQMRTPTGSSVTLAPRMTGSTEGGAGFGFASTPVDGGVDLYMTPVGDFDVEHAKDPTVAIMAGTAGSEFVLIDVGDDVGDVVTFENDQPGHASGFDPDAPTQTSKITLDKTFTTSWARVSKSGPTATVPGKIPTSYCAQPSSATYFGRRENQSLDDYLVAVGISLSNLGAGKTPDAQPLFPFMPYGGIYQALFDGSPQTNNADVAAKIVGAFETQVIEPTRHDAIEPTFDPRYGPIFFDVSNTTAFEGGSARTPMGFIADLNKTGAPLGAPAGSVQALRMAQSPQQPDQFLELVANATDGVVNPDFMNKTLRDNMFMVVTDPETLWPGSDAGHVPGNQIQLGDFTFRVNVGPHSATDAVHPKALVVFKYIPGVSLVDMVEDPLRWTKCLAPGQKPTSVKALIQKYLADAAANPNGLYDNFNAIVNDPNWSGMLVFNCPLDYQSLPPDLQILLGGIDGTLRAHHFGVTINQVKKTDSVGATTSSMAIANSALFAVIDYNKALETPESYPHFQVLKLNVEYANSKLVVFNSRIAFSLQELFGNPMALTVAPDGDNMPTNTIEIEGVYTLRQDGTGSLLFSTHDLRVYTPVEETELRVLQAQSVENATLVPVSSAQKPDEKNPGKTVTKAVANFVLDGTLVFETDIAGDLFSYGDYTKLSNTPPKGLSIIDYAFAITTTIPDSVAPATIDGIAPDLSGIKVDQGQSVSRKDSFEQTFPSTVDAVLFMSDGFDTAQTGAWQIENDGLDEIKPIYMVNFKIPMGSLGSLVSTVNNITADLYVGWTAGTTAGTADKVGAVLLLPTVVSGPRGIDIQGIFNSSFESVHLDYLTLTPDNMDPVKAYAMRFQHYACTLLNIPLAYTDDPQDLGIFGGPDDPGGDNAVWYVGKSNVKDWPNGAHLSITLPELPKVYVGRSFAIETDPTEPDVIEDAIADLAGFMGELKVEDYMNRLYANCDRYSSAAGMTFALQFEFKAVAMAMLFHDDDFYGAKIKLDFSEDDEADDDKKKEDGDKDTDKKDTDKKEDEKKKKTGLDKLEGFEFSITYRKISDHLGVWSATIFLDIGTIEVGAGSLTLPDFTISIWTNGDWRFSVGWPLSNHPITVQFQAGPIPVIGKLGFYLAKLSSEAAPEKFSIPSDPPTDPLQYPPNFKLIWAFGLGVSAGVGKEWEKGPFSAKASLSIQLTVEGFLGSFLGNINQNGVDYHWVCVSVALIGQVEGKVDFKIISASLSITLTLKIALAVETLHATHVVLTFDAEVEASVKIIFFTIHFSFSITLTLLDTSFGDGPAASLDGPNPSEVREKMPQQIPKQSPIPMMTMMMANLMPVGERARAMLLADLPVFDADYALVSGPDALFETTAAPATTIDIAFLMQTTAITDGTGWSPQGVATLVVESSDINAAFGQLSLGLANWLIAAYGGDPAAGLMAQLDETAAKLQAGAFEGHVEACLSSQFLFRVMTYTTVSDTPPPAAIFPMLPSLQRNYNGTSVQFGSIPVAANYADVVAAYFDQMTQPLTAMAAGSESVASLLFDEYFQMFAKQLITDLQQAEPADVAAGVTAVMGNVAGVLSRFMMSGLRLPIPGQTGELDSAYKLTQQQFTLAPEASLTVNLVPGADMPAWIEVENGKATATLESAQVYTAAPTAHSWTIGATPPVAPVSLRYPMNVNLNWTNAAAQPNVIFNFADSLHLAIEDWRAANPGAASAGTGPWLQLEQVTGTTSATTKSETYTASGALVLPITLQLIAKPGGAPGEYLDDIYSLVGTDEVHRAYLQALLDDPTLTVSALDLAISKSQGIYTSTEVPEVLVRTNLSTSTAPAGGGGGANAAVDAANDAAPADPNCANYAKPGECEAEQKMFLRLVWECSVVHTGGFYLQLEKLDHTLFTNGTAQLQLIVQTGAAGHTLLAEPYHNALIGAPPVSNYAVIANVTDDQAGDEPVVIYAPAYPGGSTGWTIDWDKPPVAVDVTDDAADALLGLYQMVSYRVTAINGSAVTRNWSRPVVALSQDDGSWSYQKAFATAPLLDLQDRYGAVGDTVDVDILVQDIFGNVMTTEKQTLPVVYNDPILDLSHWMATQANFEILPSGLADKVALALNLSYGTLLFTQADIADIPTFVAALQLPTNPVSVFLWSHYTVDEKTVLQNPKSTPQDVQVALIQGLNRSVDVDVSIYDASVFAGVPLSAQTQALMAADPAGRQLVFLNRLLVQDAYPTLIALQIADNTDLQSLMALRDVYEQISDQLHGPDVSAAINTSGLLAPDTPMTGVAPVGALDDPAILSGLQTYVGAVTAWLDWLIGGKTGVVADIPEPLTLRFDLNKAYPCTWSGDLRELAVSLLVRRAGVPASVADLAPDVQAVASPVVPVQGKSTAADPTGLSTFAVNFETAYRSFDDAPDGIIKVATGVNSDLKSRRLGMQSLWLARWGHTAGMTVEVVKDADTPPIFYATPPLSTQLITRTVNDLKDYTTFPPTNIESQVFSSIDIDRWAEDFLSSVETIFGPEMAPNVATRSQRSVSPGDDVQIYDPFVTSKTQMAGAIADRLAFVYASFADLPADKTDRASAVNTMRQALLDTLENDYGVATLVQMAVTIGLHGDIEPGAGSPPNIYGAVRPRAQAASAATHQPYTFSSAKVALSTAIPPATPPVGQSSAEFGRVWLNFLLSVETTAAQNNVKLDLDYQMGFIEHNIDPAETRCGYTPSDWISFVLQKDVGWTSPKDPNTLTASMGTPRIPVPLRSYPPLPKLIAATARQDVKPADIKTIADALTWTYGLTVDRPTAMQDTLNLRIKMNEPQGEAPPLPSGITRLGATGRSSDLFEALARYAYEYPQLEPHIKTITGAGDTVSLQALKDFRDLTIDVAAAWPLWVPPTPPVVQSVGSTDEVWSYAIDQDPSGTLKIAAELTGPAEATGAEPPLPVIAGYVYPPTKDTSGTVVRWIYTIESGKDVPQQLELAWSHLYVLAYQSARASAFMERNSNLGTDVGETTNPAFVYRTETVSMPSSAVPLITAPKTLLRDATATLEQGVQVMLNEMRTQPVNTLGASQPSAELRVEGPISYSFQLLANAGSDVRSFLPLFLMQADVPGGKDNSAAAAAKIAAKNMAHWYKATTPMVASSTVSFRMTVFATKIVSGSEQLPLVQFQDISLPVPDDAPTWWDEPLRDQP